MKKSIKLGLVVACLLVVIVLNAGSLVQYYNNLGVKGVFQLNGSFQTKPVTVGSAVTMTIPSGAYIVYDTGTAKTTRILGGQVGRQVILVHQSTDTIVNGVNIKLAGAANFNATQYDVLALVYNPFNATADTFWHELYRAAD